MSVTGDNDTQICWQLWLGNSCMLFLATEVPSDQGNAEDAESVKSRLLGLDESSSSTPSCTMTKLSVVSSALTPKCKDLMLYWETGNHSCQLQGGLYREPSEWAGRSFPPAQFLVIFPISNCRTQLWESCTRCDKEITSSRGHFMGVGSLWFSARKLQSIEGGFVR